MHDLDVMNIILAVHWTLALQIAYLWINRLAKRRRFCGFETTHRILISSFHTLYQIRLASNMSLGTGVFEKTWHNHSLEQTGKTCVVYRKSLIKLDIFTACCSAQTLALRFI
jgi:hypothetical protein